MAEIMGSKIDGLSEIESKIEEYEKKIASVNAWKLVLLREEINEFFANLTDEESKSFESSHRHLIENTFKRLTGDEVSV